MNMMTPSKTPHPSRLLHLMALLLGLTMLFLSACSGRNGDCEPGQKGCECLDDGSCGAGLMCKANSCEATCSLGEQGCGCLDGTTCGLSGDGQQLACAAGVCELPACEAGVLGCVCDAGACNDGLECSSASGIERCELPGCELGAQGCGCNLDRSCDAGATCVQNKCDVIDCAPGQAGCACSASFGCEAGLACDLTTETCAPIGCTTGNEGCSCLAEQSCVGELACIEGLCQQAGCEAGLEGCACRGGECGETANGDVLECVEGTCQQASCAPGQAGCACLGGTSCIQEGTSCVNGVCTLDDCIPGTLDCECLGGGCNVGLACEGGTVCVDNRGRTSGPCKEDGTCNRNNRCDNSASPAVCIRCTLGTQGCQCQDDDTCGPGLTCNQGICAGDETVHARRVPSDPSCYTPCESDLIKDDGSVVECSSEGLFPGCLDGLVCMDGNCEEPGGERDVCYKDGNCADFQICIQGHCYSECDSNDECGDGTVCHRKVCRQPCSLSQSSCGERQRCESTDGQNGFCVAVGASEPVTRPLPPEGQAGVSVDRIEFSNTRGEQTFELVNDTAEFVDFHIEKREHSVLARDGSIDAVRLVDLPDSMCSSGQCPLWWIEMGEAGQITGANELTIRATPNCLTRTAFDRAQALADADPNVAAPSPGDRCPVVTIRQPPGAIDAVRWRGAIRIDSELGLDTLQLSYVERPEGRWAGKMVYFANFEESGIDNRMEGGVMKTGWLGRDRDAVIARNGIPNDLPVTNGLIQRWGAFRTGKLNGGWEEFQAVLSATETNQWTFPNVEQACTFADACYLYSDGNDTGAGLKVYVADLDATPIPSGATEFPMALNLFTPDDAERERLVGRVVSELALHYSGSPAVEVKFEADPSDTANCDPDVLSNCVNFLETGIQGTAIEDGFQLDLLVGGRYGLGQSGNCMDGFSRRDEPWLVPGFLGEAVQDPVTGNFSRGWCEDVRLPGYMPVVSDITQEDRVANASLARANPLPDGSVLPRRVELLDGAMIDQQTLFILFRERYPSFIGGDDLVAYGYMKLERRPVSIDIEEDTDGDGIPDPYDGNESPELTSTPVTHELECSDNILSRIAMPNANLANAATREAVIQRLIDGSASGAGGAISPTPTCTSGSDEIVHYICNQTGMIDGGPDNTACWGYNGGIANDNSCGVNGAKINGICEDGGTESDTADCALGTDLADCGWRHQDVRVECPLTSDVTFFTAPASQSHYLRTHPCQQQGTCAPALQQWVNSGSVITQVDPVWTCSGNQNNCDQNPFDRRHGKTFYKKSASNVYFGGLREEIADAFRYKTQFVNRSQTSLGFTPDICVPFSTTSPYCYDPEKIEELRERVDCLVSLHRDHYSDPQDGNAAQLFSYLEENFASATEPNPLGGLPTRRDGFEKLYSELVIMLGDEAFTSAFESRFDLAANAVVGFQGEDFEVDGLSLSGISGFEMYRLHQAVQYYSLALDRFYRMSDAIAAVIESGESTTTARNYLSNETVTLYFDRLIRASTQRSRAQAEIARRYQNFNRPDLARRVALRAYTATYLESIALSNLISRLSRLANGSTSAEIVVELERAQRRYRMALLDLSNVYSSIDEDLNIFGYAPDYIPFPALKTSGGVDVNAFEQILSTALSKLDVARQREQVALSQTRQFDTDEARFQAELTRLDRTYENQLAEVCGTFVSQIDGKVYPAIEAYAYHDETLAAIGSPCGFAGNGQIHQVFGQIDLAGIELQGVITQMQNVHERVRIKTEEVAQLCDIQVEVLEYEYKIQDEAFNLSEDMIRTRETMEAAQRATDLVSVMGEFGQCENTVECATGAAAAAVTAVTTASEIVLTKIVQDRARKLRRQQYDVKQALGRWKLGKQCEMSEVSLNAQTQAMLLDLRSLEISMLANIERTNQLISEVGRLRQKAKRIELEQQEALELAINIEVAKNDPNVRIYRNDSVINAEIAFEDALREAYRLTLVYEYYTSQSYAEREELFLIRMVSAGDYNLENYIFELRNAFTAFEESFGNPDVRVELLSLRDDILRIPRVARDGSPLGIDARARMMRAELLDAKMLNKDGYIAVPFSTNIERLSPLTRNHKVLYVESNIEGNSNGDYLGRLYLRQSGTSTIHSVDDERKFYRFPERTAVLNPFFNSTREFAQSPEVYRSHRLRDRPVVNNNWELIINQRDEEVNKDIDLNALTDIKLYVYYTDFTVY